MSFVIVGVDVVILVVINIFVVVVLSFERYYDGNCAGKNRQIL